MQILEWDDHSYGVKNWDERPSAFRVEATATGGHIVQFSYLAGMGLPAGNIYRQLEDEWPQGVRQTPAIDFFEAEAHLSELNYEAVGWFHHVSAGAQNDIVEFEFRYENAVTTQADLVAHGRPIAPDAAGFLRGVYNDIPFEEMKRDDYDHFVRPPE